MLDKVEVIYNKALEDQFAKTQQHFASQFKGLAELKTVEPGQETQQKTLESLLIR